jgi:hypothetical protein
MRILKNLLILTFLISLIMVSNACGQESPQVVETTFAFDTDQEGWIGGFADLPLDYQQQGYDVSFGYAEIPVPEAVSNGLFITGNNHSDDLFMYIKRQLGSEDGLRPDTRYDAILTFKMATEVPPGMMGIGGSPGESVYIKAGVVGKEPKAVEQSGDYVMNIDKGDQSQDGRDMKVVGDAAKGEGVGQNDDTFQYKTFALSIEVTTLSEAKVWIIIGADSGFEGISRLYFDDISVTFKPISSAN